MKEQEFKLLAPAKATEIAQAAHRAGDLALAEMLYGWLLEAHPDHAEALHFLGVLLHQRDRSEAAIGMIRRSIELDQPRPDWQNDLGNVLAERQHLSAAAEAFMASLELEPNNEVVWNNLGAILQRQEQHDEAAFSYRQAIALSPEFIDALSNLGNLLAAQGETRESAEYLCRAFIAAATEATPKDQLGIAYYTLGRVDEAKEVYREWLLEEPDNPIAAHLYAACSGQNIPSRASDAYVERHFDELAESFEEQLVEKLDYRAPGLIGQVLARHALPQRNFNVLDAGCGTGLCGVQISQYASRLTGIDLSSNMLAQAEQKRVYDELLKIELTGFMRERPNAFDLVIVADTLIYFGPLEQVFDAVRTVLRPSGLFIFTVEESPLADERYCIKPNGRFGHGRAYLELLLPASGFDVLEILPAAIRIELDQPVNGFVVAARISTSRSGQAVPSQKTR